MASVVNLWQDWQADKMLKSTTLEFNNFLNKSFEKRTYVSIFLKGFYLSIYSANGSRQSFHEPLSNKIKVFTTIHVPFMSCFKSFVSQSLSCSFARCVHVQFELNLLNTAKASLVA